MNKLNESPAAWSLPGPAFEEQHTQIKTESIRKKAARNQSVVVIILHLIQSTSIKHSQSDAIKSES